jgi:hypothetical protein
MASIVVSGDTSGAITLSAPSVAGTNTITFPAATGTMMVSGNMPAFSYYSSATQNPTSGVATKVIFGTQVFDTASAVSSSRFTPQVAGYYQFNASVAMAADTLLTAADIYFYKNGSGSASFPATNQTGLATAGYYTVSTSALIYMNGSTDYVEVYAAATGTGALRYFFSSSVLHPTAFQGYLVRAA